MESPENIRGPTADEQMVRSYRIEFEDPGMQQEKESEEEREDQREEEREDERKDEEGGREGGGGDRRGEGEARKEGG